MEEMCIILEAQMRSKVAYLPDSPEDSCDGKGGEGKTGTRFRALLGTIGAPASWDLQTVEWNMPLNPSSSSNLRSSGTSAAGVC